MRFARADWPSRLLLIGAAGVIGCRGREASDTLTTHTAALTSTLASDTDTFINSSFPDNNNGASPSIYNGRNGQNGLMRGLIRFALPPGLQGRVTVDRVRLTLITRGTGPTEDVPPTAATLSLQAVTTSWSEGVGFGDAMTMFTVGQPCGSTGATWNQPNCVGGTAWAGGAVAGAVSGTASVPATLETAVTWDSASGGSGMIADVQSWIDDPASNRGWRLTSSTEGTFGAQKFYSSEETGGKGPSLIVDYSCKAAFAAAGNSCTTCTAAAIAACAGGATGTGNVCVDPGAPATTYACACNVPGYVNGGAACIDRNECVGNPCDDGGDTAATCVDHAAPATGYDCICSTGFAASAGAAATCAPAGTQDAAVTDGGDAAATDGGDGAAGAGGSGGGGGSGGENGRGGAGASGGAAGTAGAGGTGGAGGATGGVAGGRGGTSGAAGGSGTGGSAGGGTTGGVAGSSGGTGGAGGATGGGAGSSGGTGGAGGGATGGGAGSNAGTSGGTGGGAARGGATGSGGSAMAGRGGSSGAGGATGRGGSSATGTAGTTGNTGGGSGCSCTVGRRDGGPRSLAALLAAVGVMLRMRRRRSRPAAMRS